LEGSRRVQHPRGRASRRRGRLTDTAWAVTAARSAVAERSRQGLKPPLVA
jgi:hypothetical protein